MPNLFSVLKNLVQLRNEVHEVRNFGVFQFTLFVKGPESIITMITEPADFFHPVIGQYEQMVISHFPDFLDNFLEVVVYHLHKSSVAEVLDVL